MTSVVQRLFAAVENRDLDRLLACYSDDVEITEADTLPYGSGVMGPGRCVRCFGTEPSMSRLDEGMTLPRLASTASATTASCSPRCSMQTPRPSSNSSEMWPATTHQQSDDPSIAMVGLPAQGAHGDWP